MRGLGGWCLITVGPAESRTQPTTAPTRCSELFVPQVPVPKHRCLPPALGWLAQRVAVFIWCSLELILLCLAQGAAGWCKEPGGSNNSLPGVLCPPLAAHPVSQGYQPQANSLLLLNVSLVRFLPPLLGCSHGGDSQPKGSSAGQAQVKHFHQALH